MKARLELLEMLDDGERDYLEGRTSPEKDVFERLYARLADVNKE